VASLLRAAGYRTALVGKWHMGHPPHFGPLRSGYDEFFGVMAGGVDYWSHRNVTGAHDLWCGEEQHEEPGYLTDLLSRRAVGFVERVSKAADRPFFLSLHYTAPHWPWETRDDRGAAGANLFDLHGGSIHTYRRMVHHMDEGIGWVMEALSRCGVAHDTLVIFTSDNGGERFSDNWPLVGGKMDLTEGGIRVPWIAHWPAVIAPGAVSAQPCMTMDWSATVIEVAGAAGHPDFPLDGLSLLPVLRDPGRIFERPLHWRMKYRGQRALRCGQWKYLRVDGTDYLFDLVADERERANKAATQPHRLAAMREDWERWNARMPAIPHEARVHRGFSDKDMPAR
jgi:arylsulfatase A-like enzyme